MWLRMIMLPVLPATLLARCAGTGMLQNHQPDVAASQVPGNKWLLVQSAVIGESSHGIVLERGTQSGGQR
jgi:hypothetical protein